MLSITICDRKYFSSQGTKSSVYLNYLANWPRQAAQL